MFNSNNRLLDVVLPTYNNPECVKYILDNIIRYSSEKYDFALSIYDSSTNEDIKHVVEPYLNERIAYHYIDSKVNVDEKTLIAVKNSTAEYVYLIADGYCPQIDEIFNKINFNENQNELIVLYEETWKPQKKFYGKLRKFNFTDKNEFFRLHFWQLILYGGSICKRELISKINLEDMVSHYNGSGFIYPSALATYSVGPYESIIGHFIELVPYKEASGWIKNKTAIKIWAHNIYITLNKLTGILDENTVNSIIKTTGRNTGFLTAKGLANFKCNGNYDYSKYKKYKFYIKKCKGCSAFAAFIIAICPLWIMKSIRAVKRLFSK